MIIGLDDTQIYVSISISQVDHQPTIYPYYFNYNNLFFILFNYMYYKHL